MNKSNKLILFLNIGCLLIIISIYLFYNIFINTQNKNTKVKEVEKVKITSFTKTFTKIEESTTKIETTNRNNSNENRKNCKMIYNEQHAIGKLIHSIYNEHHGGKKNLTKNETKNDLDYFVMLYGINFISQKNIYDFLLMKMGWLRYDEAPPQVCLVNAMKNYQMILVSTNVSGSYIINGTTYKTQDLKITYINEIRKVSNGDSYYYNYTNYFTFKTTKTRLHLIIGSNLKFEKIEYIEDSQRLLIVDKFDRTKQINLIFYPDQIPIQIAKEYISLPNKILLDSNFKSVSTNMSTIIQFDMIVKNAYKTYSYIYNI